MRGTLTKTKQGWVVYWSNPQEYNEPIYLLPLHPDSLTELFIRSDKKLDDRIGQEIEFQIIEEIPESCHNNPFCNGDETCIQCYIKYAKIVDKLGNENVPKLGYY